MYFSDNILRSKLENVYFIWGRGKTTVAKLLKAKCDCIIYSTDDSRYPHMKLAVPDAQPYMCRDFEAEYGVKNFWLLPAEVIAEREVNFVREMTPMIIADLIELAGKCSDSGKPIICEGDIDYDAVAPIASHCVHLCCCGSKFDFFDRPDHESLDSIAASRELTDSEREFLLTNAREAVAVKSGDVPDWVMRNSVKNIVWNDSITPEQTASEVARYFGLE